MTPGQVRARREADAGLGDDLDEAGAAAGQVEQYLAQSGLAHTLVRPHSFMQNFLLSAQPVAERGVLYGMTGEAGPATATPATSPRWPPRC